MFLDRPSDQLDVYIKNLERVLDAIEFFNQNNQNCLELANLVSALPYIKSLSVCPSFCLSVCPLIWQCLPVFLAVCLPSCLSVCPSFWLSAYPLSSHKVSLQEYGRDSLEKEFRNLLNRHSKPVPAATIFELVGTDEGKSSEPPISDHPWCQA